MEVGEKGAWSTDRIRATTPASGCLPPEPLGKSGLTHFTVESYGSQKMLLFLTR